MSSFQLGKVLDLIFSNSLTMQKTLSHSSVGTRKKSEIVIGVPKLNEHRSLQDECSRLKYQFLFHKFRIMTKPQHWLRLRVE